LAKISEIIVNNKDILNSLTFKILQQFGGVLLLFFVTKYLSAEEQGYYFTFASIVAIQVFFELGLSNVIVQFVAHENSSIDWNNSDNEKFSFNISRLSSLLYFTVKWFSFISGILFFVLSVVGYMFFNFYDKNDHIVFWKTPWLVIVLNASFSLLINAVLSFLEGLDKIAFVAKIRSYQQLFSIGLSSLLFFMNFKLLAVPIAMTCSLLIVSFLVLSTKEFKFLRRIWILKGPYEVDYKNEIFPLQWRIGLSWISGYFIFQLINPLLFAIEGPVIAGKMGISMTVLNAIFSFGFIWITTKIPKFSSLIVAKDYDLLDKLYLWSLVKSSGIVISGMVVFKIILELIDDFQFINFPVREKFLDSELIYIMMIIVFLNHVVGSFGVYLRCHKKEPLLTQSLVMSFLSAISFYFSTSYYGLIGLVYSNLTLTILGFIWAYFVFVNSKKDWHV